MLTKTALNNSIYYYEFPLLYEINQILYAICRFLVFVYFSISSPVSRDMIKLYPSMIPPLLWHHPRTPWPHPGLLGDYSSNQISQGFARIPLIGNRCRGKVCYYDIVISFDHIGRFFGIYSMIFILILWCFISVHYYQMGRSARK